MLKSRLYFIISIFVILILTLSILLVFNFNNKTVLNPIGGEDRPYYFRIELSQWSMKVIDLNRIEDSILDGYSLNKAFNLATYEGYLGKLEKGSQVFLQIYSLDVQHGISINELDISISILEPTEDIDSSLPFYYNFNVPANDMSITAYCQVYCGLGHSNMKFRFDVGRGGSNYGILTFNSFIILNGLIAIIFSYLITSPIKRKVYLKKRDPKPTNKSNSGLIKFDLFDISTFSEKDLIALRLGYLDISKRGVVLDTYEVETIEKAKLKILSSKYKNNSKLVKF